MTRRKWAGIEVSEKKLTSGIKCALDKPVLRSGNADDGRASLGCYGCCRSMHGRVGDVAMFAINEDELHPQFHENINISPKQEENRPYVETHLRKHSRKIGTG